MKIDRKKLFKIAHSIWKKAKATSFGEALRMAWKAIRIYSEMLVGEVHFTFVKANGEVREAIGTLHNIDYTPSPATAGKPRAERPADCICYWDVEKGTFRSFNAYNLI